MSRCVYFCWVGGSELVVIDRRILYFFWFTGWRLGNREQNFGLFLVDILLIFDLLLFKYLSNDFYLTKVAKFFGGDKIMHDFFCLKPYCLLF